MRVHGSTPSALQEHVSTLSAAEVRVSTPSAVEVRVSTPSAVEVRVSTLSVLKESMNMPMRRHYYPQNKLLTEKLARTRTTEASGDEPAPIG